MVRKLFVTCVIIGGTLTASADPFRNLGFEERNAAGLTPGEDGPTSSLLPGWSFYFDGQIYPFIGYNRDITFAPAVSFFDEFNTLYRPAEGQAFLGMTTTSEVGTERFLEWSLRQSGDVPVDAKSITFPRFSQGLFRVEADGNSLPMVLQGGEFIFDISAYAGKHVELSFNTEKTPVPPGGMQSDWRLDGIRFSTAPVPEPSTCALLALGGLTIFALRACDMTATPERK